MTTSSAHDFIERMKDASFRIKMAPLLRSVQEGDWDRIVQIARQEGYDFTVPEIKEALPERFFKGSGKRPDRGWSKSTLDT
jgi:hypothetical protein